MNPDVSREAQVAIVAATLLLVLLLGLVVGYKSSYNGLYNPSGNLSSRDLEEVEQIFEEGLFAQGKSKEFESIRHTVAWTKTKETLAVYSEEFKELKFRLSEKERQMKMMHFLNQLSLICAWAVFVNLLRIRKRCRDLN